MDRIPQDVTDAVRVVAAAAPGYPGDLADVHRRARRRRNRQTVVSAVAVLAVLAGGGAGMAMWRGAASPIAPAAPAARVPSITPAPSITPVPVSQAQPLILDDAFGVYRVPGGPEMELGGDRRAGELQADGSLFGYPVVGSRGWEKVVRLPDGGIVAFGSHDTMPGVERTDGPDVIGLEYRLVVTGADGRVRIQRDLRRKDEPVMLLTADATTAYLWRPEGLIAHDLDTGTEQVVVKRTAVGIGRVFGELRHSDLSAGRLAVASVKTECLPRVFDLATGRLTAEVRLDRSTCIAVNRMRLSPDGSTLAVAYQYKSTGKRIPAAVALIRLSDGAVLDRQERIGMVDGVSLAVSLAWQDDRTLRGAEYPVAAGGVSEVNGFILTAR
jgi:hypothetical protein